MSAARVLVTGCNGLLGQKVTELLVRGTGATIVRSSVEPSAVRQLRSVSYRQLDITSKKDVRSVVADVAPDVIINCAALTDVDGCERERERAWKINVTGVENLIEGARRCGAKIMHVSSDYVFDGKSGPYAEDARPAPINYYGKTKLASENALRTSDVEFFIARTMVLYGFATSVKPNFALWVIQTLSKGEPVRVVDDQTGNPTLADDLAYGLLRAMELERKGIYNIAGRDIVTRYDFAVRIATFFGLDPALIRPTQTSQLKQLAPRPMKSGLITLKAEVELGIRPATVDEGLAVLKSQLSRSDRRLGDSAPVPGQQGGRKGAGRKDKH